MTLKRFAFAGLLLPSLSFTSACSPSAAGGEAIARRSDERLAPSCKDGTLAVTGSAIAWTGSCPGVSLALAPRARLGGQWRGGGADGPCTVTATSLACPAGPAGSVVAEIDGRVLRVRFDAAATTTVESLDVEGTLTLPGAAAWLSNGFQSWSMSGVVALAEAPSDGATAAALAVTGEDEVYRRGAELSNWYTFVKGRDAAFVAGALGGERLRPWLQVSRPSDGAPLSVRIASGATEAIAVSAGASAHGERFLVSLGDKLEDGLAEYGRRLPTRRATRPTPPLAGWNSWYTKWDDVREGDLTGATGAASPDVLARLLTPVEPPNAPSPYVVLDDGWEVTQGDWEPNAKFPSGIAGVAASVHGKGLRFGIWIAPFLVNPSSALAKAHPDWLVGGAAYKNGSGASLSVLDVTNPDAASHLTETLRGLVAAGADLLKIDFLFAGALEGKRHAPATGLEAYHAGMALVRSAVGDSVVLDAVGAPPVATFPYVDAWRVGNDIAFKPAFFGIPRPSWAFIANQARQLAARWPYCLATLCDADPALLRDPLTRDEVDSGAWVAAFAGGAFFLSDDLPTLGADRVAWGLSSDRLAVGLSGVPARPETFLPDAVPTELASMKDGMFVTVPDQRVPTVWRLPDGRRLAVNFGGQGVVVEGVAVPQHGARALSAAHP